MFLTGLFELLDILEKRVTVKHAHTARLAIAKIHRHVLSNTECDLRIWMSGIDAEKQPKINA